MRVGIVVNPVSGGGRATRHAASVRDVIAAHADDVEMVETAGPGEATRLAQGFAARGFDLVIALGGDGTIGEVADGLLRHIPAEGGRRPDYAFVSAGTGSDFRRNFPDHDAPEAAALAIMQAQPRPVDAGHVRFVDGDGQARDRYFINIASLGISGVIAGAVNHAKLKGRTSGKLIFLYHTIRELLRYPFQTISISLDGGAFQEERIAVVAIANGAWFGGGMRVAPDADLSDGLFDVVIMQASSRLRLIANLYLIYSGKHRFSPFVRIVRASRVDVSPAGGLAVNAAILDVDGESPGHLSACYQIIPGALMLRA